MLGVRVGRIVPPRQRLDQKMVILQGLLFERIYDNFEDPVHNTPYRSTYLSGVVRMMPVTSSEPHI
jgi:hypothetical protein